jgi:PAS domain S-box-containing protein
MPEVDGLTLLKQVREDHPDLPFILATGRGSEDVAVEAIAAGVNDYIVKMLEANQASLFAARIERVVAEHRLRRAVEANERQYRAVIEGISEGLAIVIDGRVVFQNTALAEMAGTRHSRLGELFQAGDASTVEQYCDRLLTGQHPEGRVEARLERGDGTSRHCLVSGRQIDYLGDSAALLLIRDITPRIRRQQQLERERQINRAVREKVLTARSREQLEAAVCELLVRFGYGVAFVVSWDGDTGEPRTSAGEAALVDELFESNGGETLTGWAARASESKVVTDVGDLFDTDYRDHITNHGFSAGAAFPLVRNNIRYGVLTVYHDDASLTSDMERELLGDIADTVAFGIHNIETSQSLASGSLLEVQVQVAGTAHYLGELLDSTAKLRSQGEITVLGTSPSDDGEVIQYVEVASGPPADLVEAASAHDAVTAVEPLNGDGEKLRLTVEASVPELEAAAAGARVTTTTVTAGQATLTFQVPTSRNVSAVVDGLGGEWQSASITAIKRIEGVETEVSSQFSLAGVGLTDKQRAALQAAYHHGYFEQPRSSSASDVAAELDIAHSTFLQHLRAAQKKVFAAQFG